MKTDPWVMMGLCVMVGASSLQAQDLRFTGYQRQTNRELLLQWTAPASQKVRIDVSSQLPQWEPLITLTSTGLNQHLDSGAPYRDPRFYRAEQLGTTNMTGDHLGTTNGSVVILPLNHATFVMSWNGKLIAVDPPQGGSSYFTGLPRADLVLITHDHTDHFSTTTLDAVRAASAPIIVPQVVFNKLTTAEKPLATVLANGASTMAIGLNIEAVPAYNLTVSNHPKGAGNGYVLTIGGRKIYIAGDTEDTPEMRALRNIDLAMVPMNEPYTMTVTKAVSAVREFRPKVVYPYHYRNSNGTFADLNAFKRQVGTDLGIEVRLRKWY